MASGIPTRRVTRRADENAPPAISDRTRSRSTATIPTLKSTATSASAAGAAPSRIPALKRTHSTISSTTTAPNQAAPGGKGTAATTRRSALGEVKNVGKDKAGDAPGKGTKGNGKAGDAIERKPLASTTSSQGGVTAGGASRRTRPAASSTATSTLGGAVKEEKPVLKRKTTASHSQPVGAGVSSKAGSAKVHVPARSRSTTASTSVSEPRLKERSLNTDASASGPSGSTTVRATAKQEVKVEVTETEPVRKKRKTSSPVAVAEDLRDLVDEGVYDADGREVVLSSGGRGTSLKSPKASRPKDYGWTDLDAEDEGDPSMVSEYVVDAFNYMMSIEPQTMADPEYMTRQAELTWSMRTILMEWLVEVHSKFRLLPETLLIAVNLVDRFLTLRVVSLAKLQLVGLTAMFIAAKYEEVICPSIQHFIHMTDESFEMEEMLRAERYMLSTLQFDLSYPNPLHFLRRISKADDYDMQTRTVAKFLIEIVLVEQRLIGVEPSRLAAAAIWLARLCLERGEWTPNLVHYSGYSEAEVIAPAQVMLDYLLDADFNADSAFYRKYATKKHMKASVYMRTWAMEHWPGTVDGTNPHAGRELEAMILEED